VELKPNKGVDNTICRGSSNRTKVELKRQKDLEVRQTIRLPIEPKWNWNKYGLIDDIDDKTSNRTKVELKHGHITRDEVGYLTSNRTKVELKRCFATYRQTSLVFQSNQSGIETIKKAFSPFRTVLPIEPKWNWNFSISQFCCGKGSSNRTKVELKRIIHWTRHINSRLPIEPKWNWNPQWVKVLAFLRPSNRTKVELKRMYETGSHCINKTSNRTKVELKQFWKIRFLQ